MRGRMNSWARISGLVCPFAGRPRECELHLGLDARRPGDPASLRGCRLAPQHQRAALARTYSGDESIQLVTLAVTVEQPRR